MPDFQYWLAGQELPSPGFPFPPSLHFICLLPPLPAVHCLLLGLDRLLRLNTSMPTPLGSLPARKEGRRTVFGATELCETQTGEEDGGGTCEHGLVPPMRQTAEHAQSLALLTAL